LRAGQRQEMRGRMQKNMKMMGESRRAL
jgi:hypothetical protein